MKELFRSNDPVRLSWAEAVLTAAGIETVIADRHTSVIEGSIGAIQRRLLVAEEDFARARTVLEAAEPAR
jgi:Putative prokaryotic signal transducing protein